MIAASDLALVEKTQELIASIFDFVDAVGGDFLAMWRRTTENGAGPTSRDVATLGSSVRARLAVNPAVEASGIVVAPNTLVDNPKYFHWWQRSHEAKARSRLEPLMIRVDPVVYDCYVDNEVYRELEAGQKRMILGPKLDYAASQNYFDYAGEHLYDLTFVASASAPSGLLLGCVNADVPAAKFEKALLPALRDVGSPRVLVNADRRVIVGNDPNHPTGARIKPLENYSQRCNVIGTGWTWVDMS